MGSSCPFGSSWIISTCTATSDQPCRQSTVGDDSITAPWRSAFGRQAPASRAGVRRRGRGGGSRFVERAAAASVGLQTGEAGIDQTAAGEGGGQHAGARRTGAEVEVRRAVPRSSRTVDRAR